MNQMVLDGGKKNEKNKKTNFYFNNRCYFIRT